MKLMGKVVAFCAICFLVVFFSSKVFGSTTERSLRAIRINEAPIIDGTLDEDVWLEHKKKSYFYQFEPENGKPSSFATEVCIAYTDRAVYIAAWLYDYEPDSILRELGLRDSGRNTDMFGVAFDTYKNGQNAFFYQVSAAGVQTDVYVTNGHHDRSWDAVWKSAVKITDKGWTVEMEIPYHAIRFPKKDVQLWGINFMRKVQRKNETSYWNYIDNSIAGFANQFGRLEGINYIQPPTRLSVLPYVTSYLNVDGENQTHRTALTGGMDLKLGLNESFTLDMSLIPDFGQVQSDNVVLNLSPFEVRFDENRPFFTEGTDLFNKGNLFYSRRVGRIQSIDIDDNEEVVSRPSETPLLNATKVSGRNRKGLGLGFFNAITKRATAVVENTETLERREINADPMTNYNAFVIDQNLKYNSNISLINTNVSRENGFANANVTGTDFRFFDKTNTYRLRGFSAISHKYGQFPESDESPTGYKYFLELSKVSGNVHFHLNRDVESNDYDPNDLGFLTAPNKVNHYAHVSYHFFKPFSIFNRLNAGVYNRYNMLYKPSAFTSYYLRGYTNAQFKNFWYMSLSANSNPIESFDYFEPREDGYFFKLPSRYSGDFYVSSDWRKKISFSTWAGAGQRTEWDQRDVWFGVAPNFRLSDKLSFNHNFNVSQNINSIGYVDKMVVEDELSNIIFGKRKIKTFENVIGGSYTFNNRMGLNFRMRHYWRNVNYDDFYFLEKSGDLKNADYSSSSHDINFNALNLDVVYTWQIAPGSFVNIVWKDIIVTDHAFDNKSLFDNVNGTLQAPQFNSVSVKILYFLDYMTLKDKIFHDKHDRSIHVPSLIANNY